MINFLTIFKYISLTLVLLLFSADKSLPYAETSAVVTTQPEDVSWYRSLMFTQEQEVAKFTSDSVNYYKEQAIYAASQDDVENASYFLEEYVKYSGEHGFVATAYFKRFDGTPEFEKLHSTYSLNFSWLNFFYLFSALIGFFIGFMLLLLKNKDRVATLMISTFVLIHSVFIFHLFLFLTKLQFRVPDTFFMSSIFSYLYGPLIYFYFKRVTLNYKFRRIDLLHAIPTVLIIFFTIPVFMLPTQEKLNVMLGVGYLDKMPYLQYGFSTKLLSLLLYGYLVLRVYFKTKNTLQISLPARQWIRNLVTLTQVYVLTYVVYGLIIVKVIPRSEFLYHLQIVAMASMVLYIGYKSYVRPNLFTTGFTRPRNKYVKSGLTPSFSTELKEQLLHLLETEKIYRQNDISLAKVSDLLGTTRHNASQVINEHFGLNFFELINSYRINEAKEILKNDRSRKRNIIDVAYEVGFNNKVTFNKSFRKQLSVTPSQFLNGLSS
ncbi:MAG: helix-turn-helix transcriptional regulator [Bacteroidota bacterium]